MKSVSSFRIKAPCKVGQFVYVPWVWNDNNGIACVIVEALQFVRDTDLCGFFIDLKSDDQAFNDVYGYWHPFSDLGKSVFLSLSDAERALVDLLNI